MKQLCLTKTHESNFANIINAIERLSTSNQNLNTVQIDKVRRAEDRNSSPNPVTSYILGFKVHTNVQKGRIPVILGNCLIKIINKNLCNSLTLW